MYAAILTTLSRPLLPAQASTVVATASTTGRGMNASEAMVHTAMLGIIVETRNYLPRFLYEMLWRCMKWRLRRAFDVMIGCDKCRRWNRQTYK